MHFRRINLFALILKLLVKGLIFVPTQDVNGLISEIERKMAEAKTNGDKFIERTKDECNEYLKEQAKYGAKNDLPFDTKPIYQAACAFVDRYFGKPNFHEKMTLLHLRPRTEKTRDTLDNAIEAFTESDPFKTKSTEDKTKQIPIWGKNLLKFSAGLTTKISTELRHIEKQADQFINENISLIESKDKTFRPLVRRALLSGHFADDAYRKDKIDELREYAK